MGNEGSGRRLSGHRQGQQHQGRAGSYCAHTGANTTSQVRRRSEGSALDARQTPTGLALCLYAPENSHEPHLSEVEADLLEHVLRVALFAPQATAEDFAGLNLLPADAKQGAGAGVVGDLGEGWRFETLNRAFRLLVAKPARGFCSRHDALLARQRWVAAGRRPLRRGAALCLRHRTGRARKACTAPADILRQLPTLSGHNIPAQPPRLSEADGGAAGVGWSAVNAVQNRAASSGY